MLMRIAGFGLSLLGGLGLLAIFVAVRADHGSFRNVALDIPFHDTFFVVAHFHVTAFLCLSSLALLAGILLVLAPAPH